MSQIPASSRAVFQRSRITQERRAASVLAFSDLPVIKNTNRNKVTVHQGWNKFAMFQIYLESHSGQGSGGVLRVKAGLLGSVLFSFPGFVSLLRHAADKRASLAIARLQQPSHNSQKHSSFSVQKNFVWRYKSTNSYEMFIEPS